MGYLVCDKCKGYYELKDGESPEDFENECDCGGKLVYAERIDNINSSYEEAPINMLCPVCGSENPEMAEFCAECGNNIRQENEKTLTNAEKLAKLQKKYNKPKTSKNKFDVWWNKQSSKNKKVFSLVGICCLGLILIVGISAMVSPDKTTSTVPSTTSSGSSPTTTTTTSNPVMSESEYISKAQDWNYDMKEVVDDISFYADNYLTLSDSSIISGLKKDQITTKRVLGEMSSTTPPSKYAHIHSTIKSAFQDIDSCLTYFISGVEKPSVNDIDTATNYLESSTSKINQATDELDSL